MSGRLVLFDLDGTLINSRDDIAAAANAALEAVGLPRRPADEIASFVGSGARRLIERAVGPAQPALHEPALAAFFAYYGEHLVERTTVYPGVAELLAALPGTLTVLTNKPGKFARPICERLGIAARFEAIVGAGDMPAHKPDPRGALELLARFGARAAEARFVGDSRIDAETARNAGIPFVGVTWGYGSEPSLREAGATNLVGDAAGLARALAE